MAHQRVPRRKTDALRYSPIPESTTTPAHTLLLSCLLGCRPLPDSEQCHALITSSCCLMTRPIKTSPATVLSEDHCHTHKRHLFMLPNMMWDYNL